MICRQCLDHVVAEVSKLLLTAEAREATILQHPRGLPAANARKRPTYPPSKPCHALSFSFSFWQNVKQ